jgi:glycyl-tRNA synthetase beta subunit
MSEEKDTNKEDKRKSKQKYKAKLPYVFWEHRQERVKQGVQNKAETERRVFEVADMIVAGKTKETCIKHLMQTYKISNNIASQYYQASCEYLMPKDIDKHRKQLIEKNLIRLERIVEKTMDRENYRDAINAIKEINRCINPNSNTVEVATKDTAFKITFSND